MSKDEKRYDLASIDPLRPAPDADEAGEQRERADRIGFVAAAAVGSPPAVGVAAEQANEAAPNSETEDREPQPR